MRTLRQEDTHITLLSLQAYKIHVMEMYNVQKSVGFHNKKGKTTYLNED